MRFVLALAAILAAFALGGGSNALGTQDVRAELNQFHLEDPCTYQTPSIPGSTAVMQHLGTRIEMVIVDPDVISTASGCRRTLWYGSNHRPDFLQGEYYFTIRANNPYHGCIQFNVAGLRKGVYYGHAGRTPIPPTYSNHYNNASEKVCGLEKGEEVELLWMTCPDVSGPSGPDNRIGLNYDIFDTIFAFGLTKGSPGWNPLTDHNEDGIVDLLNDIFSVIGRYSLNCDDFPQME